MRLVRHCRRLYQRTRQANLETFKPGEFWSYRVGQCRKPIDEHPCAPSGRPSDFERSTAIRNFTTKLVKVGRSQQDLSDLEPAKAL